MSYDPNEFDGPPNPNTPNMSPRRESFIQGEVKHESTCDMNGHVLLKSSDCTCFPYDDCPLCDQGLAVCAVCGAVDIKPGRPQNAQDEISSLKARVELLEKENAMLHKTNNRSMRLVMDNIKSVDVARLERLEGALKAADDLIEEMKLYGSNSKDGRVRDFETMYQLARGTWGGTK